MSDRPHDQGGPGSPPPDQGGSGEQGGGFSLSKGDAGPGDQPTYGYGAPAYGAPDSGQNPSTDQQPSYGAGDQSAYGTGHQEPAYGEQSTGYQQQPSYGGSSGGYDPQGSYAPPAAGAAYGAGAYGAPGGPGQYGTATPPKKKRTGLVIGIIAVGLVVVIGLAIGLVALFAGGGGKPSETVKAYLQAMADGDAAKALEQGEKPPDTTFVTSDALKAQQGIAKITAIDVSDGYSSGKNARVSATYKFGDKQADESFSLTKIDGEWKLNDTTYPIDLTGINDVPGLTLMGISADGKDKAYVFPGPLVWGSSNEYLSVKESEPDDFTLSPSDGSFSFSTLETDLSDKGQEAVATAVQTFIDTCAKSKDLAPENCPQAEYDYEGVDGTAVWKAPSDLSSLEYRTSSPVTEVYVSGDLTWSVTYTAEDYDGKRSSVTDNEVDGSLYGKVDLSKSPPVYSE